jgi:hypothetical protein
VAGPDAETIAIAKTIKAAMRIGVSFRWDAAAKPRPTPVPPQFQ